MKINWKTAIYGAVGAVALHIILALNPTWFCPAVELGSDTTVVMWVFGLLFSAVIGGIAGIVTSLIVEKK